MRRMPAQVLRQQQADVVLGPCPGCESWQLDYTYAAVAQFAVPTFEELYEFGSEEPVAGIAGWDSSAFHEAVEDALAEHLAECVHLRMLLPEL